MDLCYDSLIGTCNKLTSFLTTEASITIGSSRICDPKSRVAWIAAWTCHTALSCSDPNEKLTTFPALDTASPESWKLSICVEAIFSGMKYAPFITQRNLLGLMLFFFMRMSCTLEGKAWLSLVHWTSKIFTDMLGYWVFRGYISHTLEFMYLIMASNVPATSCLSALLSKLSLI